MIPQELAAAAVNGLDGSASVAVSAGLSRDLRSAIAVAWEGFDVLPILRGIAVIDKARSYDRVILGWPNYLGRYEMGTDRAMWIWDRDLTALLPPGACVSHNIGDAGDREHRTALAAVFAKALNQRSRVVYPWVPTTPVAIVHVPVDPATLAVEPPIEPLGGDFLGHPGGVRWVVPPAMSHADVAAYADEVGRAIEDGR